MDRSAKAVSRPAVPDRNSGIQKGRMKVEGSIGRHTYTLLKSDLFVLFTQKWPQYTHGTAHHEE